MAVVTDKFIFAHIPKTGGQFVRHVIEMLRIEHREVGKYHSMPNSALRTGVSLPSMITVRHPVTWYQSRWYHRIRHGWPPQNPIDWECASNDFNQFVLSMIEYDPNGRLCSIINSFLESKNRFNYDVKWVLKNERLTQELYNLLRELDYKFDKDRYFNLRKINVSGNKGASSGDFAVYRPDVLEKLLEHESWVINRFYDGITDPNALSDQLVL
jgi:hypothetical protein